MLRHRGRLEHINCVNASRHYYYLLLSLPETYGENANVPMFDYYLRPTTYSLAYPLSQSQCPHPFLHGITAKGSPIKRSIPLA